MINFLSKGRRGYYDNQFVLLLVIISLFSFGIYMWVAFHLPTDLSCPDEPYRRMIPFYLVQNGKLPTGYELELNSANVYGFSYASYPPFPAFLSAIFIKLASLITTSERYLIIASRLGNVFLGSVSVMYLMKIGKAFFNNNLSALLLTCLVGFMPQVIFINSYFNADSISLCAVILILYYLIIGNQQRWSINICIKLAIAMSMCILTYYNAYGWCLIAVIYCLASVIFSSDLNAKQKKHLLLCRSLLVAGICISLTGWYFVRNYILYHGDFLAINIRNEIALMTAAQGYDIYCCTPYANTGTGVLDMIFSANGWLEASVKSLIGVFGQMLIYLNDTQYFYYKAVIIVGIICALPVLYKDREKRLFYLLLLIASAITIGLSIYYSYAVDYQPQGRYIISILPAIALFSVIGFREIGNYISALVKTNSLKVSDSVHHVTLLMSSFVLLSVYMTAVQNNVFIHNELIYTIEDRSQEIAIQFIPAENEQIDSVNIAVWNSEASPTWYPAANSGSEWIVEWHYTDQPSGNYNVHVYMLTTNGAYKEAVCGSFMIDQGNITLYQ